MNVEMALPVLSMEIEGVTLRPFRTGDKASTQKAINHPGVASGVTNIPNPYTLEHTTNWVLGCSSYVTNQSKRIDYAIVKEGDVIGSVALIRINNSEAESHEAQVSMWLSPDDQRQGIMPVALARLIQFGFENLGLVRIFGYTYYKNYAAQSVIKKAGMQAEGVKKRSGKRLSRV